MNKTLTFRQINELFQDSNNEQIVIWDLFYIPKKSLFGNVDYRDKKGENMAFPAGLIITILNKDNQYYQIVTTAFQLQSFDLIKMVYDPKFIVGDLSMTWLNFLIFKKTPMGIIKGWFIAQDNQVELTITHVYNRKQNEPWKDLYQEFKTKNSILPLDSPIISELKGYEKITSINSVYTMPDIAMIIRNIENI